MIICGPLVAIAIVAGSPGLDAREPLRDQSPEQLARRLIDASTIRVAVESAVPVSLGLIEKKGTEITPETRALIDRWFSDEHLDELLIPLYLRHLTPEAMAAAAEFYATEPGASFASKLVGLRTGTVPEPTAEPSPEAEELARQLQAMWFEDLGIGEDEVYSDLAKKEQAGIVAMSLTIEELTAALSFYRSPPGLALPQGQRKVVGDLGLAVLFRLEGLILPAKLLSPLAMDRYWPKRHYTEVMSFFGRPSFIVPKQEKTRVELFYVIDDQGAQEMLDSSRVTEPETFAGFDPSADEEWLALDTAFRERYPDLADIPPPGHISLARFDLDEDGRVERAAVVLEHEGVRQYLTLTRRMLELHRRLVLGQRRQSQQQE